MNETNIPFTEYGEFVSLLKNLKLLEKPLPVTVTLLLGNVVAPNLPVPNVAVPNNEGELKFPTANFLVVELHYFQNHI